MAAITSTAGPVRSVARPGRHRRPPTLTGTGERLLAAWRDFYEGESWEPGRAWLTRVTPPGETDGLVAMPAVCLTGSR